MTNPMDSRENRALNAAQAITTQVGHLWMAAFADGVRDCLASVTDYLDEIARNTGDDYSLDPTLRQVCVTVCESLRDQLRLHALSLPEPQPPTPPWEAR